MAPQYLQRKINLRKATHHGLRLDDDFYQLAIPGKPQLARTYGCFTYLAPKLWNELPYDLRCLTEIELFKTKLKTHLFAKAFSCNAEQSSDM